MARWAKVLGVAKPSCEAVALEAETDARGALVARKPRVRRDRGAVQRPESRSLSDLDLDCDAACRVGKRVEVHRSSLRGSVPVR